MTTERPNVLLDCGGIAVDMHEVTDIAQLASEAILKIYRTDPATWEVLHKENDMGPLTLADTDANEIIVTGLKARWPAIPIISEEEKEIPWETRREFDYFWCVDPLDGTKEFIKRNGQFTVNIGLCRNSSPIGGVVTVPTETTCYYAAEGLGAYKKITGPDGKHVTQRIRAASFKETDSGLTVIDSRSHQSSMTTAFISKFKDANFKKLGSSLKILYVAEGTAHVYPRFVPCCEWDTAAAHSILKESGGSIIQMNGGETAAEGSELVYNKESLLNPFFVAYGAREAQK